MDRISICELTTLRWSFEQDVEFLDQLGFDSIGVCRRKLSDFGEEKGAELLADRQFAVSSLHWAGGFTGIEGVSHVDAIEDAKYAIETAAQLQAACLILHSGGQAGHTRRHAERLYLLAIEALLPQAEACGVRLAIEPMCSRAGRDWTIVHTLWGGREICERFASDNLGLVFDLYHMATAQDLSRQLLQALDRTFLVQLSGSREAQESTALPRTQALPIARCEQQRCCLEDGAVDVLRWVDLLDRHGYDGQYELEIYGESVEGLSYEELLVGSRETLAANYSGIRSKQAR